MKLILTHIINSFSNLFCPLVDTCISLTKLDYFVFLYFDVPPNIRFDLASLLPCMHVLHVMWIKEFAYFFLIFCANAAFLSELSKFSNFPETCRRAAFIYCIYNACCCDLLLSIFVSSFVQSRGMWILTYRRFNVYTIHFHIVSPIFHSILFCATFFPYHLSAKKN